MIQATSRPFAWYWSLALQLLAIGLAGVAGCTCRYSFSQSSLPSHIKTVAVPVFENETVEPGLQQEVTEAVSREFLNDSTLRIVPENEAAS